jgi:hypothetical protein
VLINQKAKRGKAGRTGEGEGEGELLPQNAEAPHSPHSVFRSDPVVRLEVGGGCPQ